MFKKAGILTSCIAAMALPLAAHAWAPLTIVNHSTLASVVKIGATGLCSNVMGEAGITRPGATKSVDENILFGSCFTTPDDCTATVYLNAAADCNGAPAGIVTYSLNKGITSSSNGQVTVVSASEVDLG